MTLKHLRIFAAVCESGGITRAAETLHMVQPAVSTAISELEKYYKVSLFDRVNKRLVLTELGKELLIKAKNILNEFDNFEEAAVLGGKRVRLKAGSSLTLGKTVLPEFAVRIKELIPSLQSSFIIDKASVIESKLECGELDIGLIEGEIKSEQLKKIPLAEDKLIAVCSPEYNIQKEVTVFELVKEPMLLRERGSASRELLEKTLSQKHISVSPFAESISNEALLSFAKNSLGIAVLPQGIVSEAICRAELKEIKVKDAEFTRVHYMAVRKNKNFNAVLQSAADILSDLYGRELC